MDARDDMTELEYSRLAIAAQDDAIRELHASLVQALRVIEDLWDEMKGQPPEFVEWFYSEREALRGVVDSYNIAEERDGDGSKSFHPGWQCNTCGWRVGSIGYPPSHNCPEDGEAQATHPTTGAPPDQGDGPERMHDAKTYQARATKRCNHYA